MERGEGKVCVRGGGTFQETVKVHGHARMTNDVRCMVTCDVTDMRNNNGGLQQLLS